ncbi:MAG: protein phosphatase 2C domain-containing protein [Anaerolineae bacterium]|nr:protein phosphatase 2C domain-containing protein [Anaerolineae bacterium]
MRRTTNEDSIAYKYPSNYDLLRRRGVLLALAEGVAMSKSGAEASQAAVSRLIDNYYSQPNSWDCRLALLQAVKQVNAEVHRLYHKSSTTLIAAVIHNANIFIAHVGDSRAYHYHDKMLEQVTNDHIVQKQRPKGGTKPKLTRAIGHRKTVKVDITEMPIHEGNTFLLVSDGVTRYLENQHLQQLLRNSPTETVRDIIQASNQAGGIDNISAIIVRVGRVLQNEESLANHLEQTRPQIMVDIPDAMPVRKVVSAKIPLPFDRLRHEPLQTGRLPQGRGQFWFGIMILLIVIIAMLAYSIFVKQ